MPASHFINFSTYYKVVIEYLNLEMSYCALDNCNRYFKRFITLFIHQTINYWEHCNDENWYSLASALVKMLLKARFRQNQTMKWFSWRMCMPKAINVSVKQQQQQITTASSSIHVSKCMHICVPYMFAYGIGICMLTCRYTWADSWSYGCITLQRTFRGWW